MGTAADERLRADDRKRRADRGGAEQGDNPAVPLTTEEIAADAVACALGLSPAGASRALAGSPTTGR